VNQEGVVQFLHGFEEPCPVRCLPDYFDRPDSI